MRTAILCGWMLCLHRIKPETLDEHPRTCNLGIIGCARCDTQAGATLPHYPNSRSRPARIERMAKGNPNPSPATRFTSSGNPAGKTSEHRQAEVVAAEISAKIRMAAIIRMQEKIEAGEMDPLEAITGDNLRLFRDSEDRAHGTPKQSVEHSGDPDRPLTIIERRIVKADD